VCRGAAGPTVSRGLFVAFEGGEGVGKSTQIEAAAEWLRGLGHTVVATREPGGTPLGRELRALVLDPAGHVTPRAEALLYAADRAQHVEWLVRPSLDAGSIVLTDRFLDSTLAYQGAGRGLTVEQTRVVVEWATGGLLPDLTVLLDLDPEAGLFRAAARSTPDRLEAASLEFHQAVRAGFLDLAAADPERYLVINADDSPEHIADQVRAGITARLG
jgi:dTMP kinase